MKTLTSLLASLALVAVISGCASSGHQRASRTAHTLNNTAERLDRGTNQLDAALTALTQLVETPAPDMKPQFSQLNTSINDLESLSRNLGRLSVSIQQQGAAYFQQWDEKLATIQNADIREASTKRKDAVVRQFESVKTSAEDARNKLNPFVADLVDLRTALRIDLTPGGLEAVRPTATRINSKGAAVRDSLAKLAIQFREMSTALSAGVPAPAPAPAK